MSSKEETNMVCNIKVARQQSHDNHMIMFPLLLGRRSAVSTCTFSKDGKLIAGAMIDGSIQLWKSKGPYVSENLLISLLLMHYIYVLLNAQMYIGVASYPGSTNLSTLHEKSLPFFPVYC